MPGQAVGPGQAAARLQLATVDSTNLEAFRQAPHLAGPLWIMAGEQTAGRGRRARPWVSPPGNFYASFVQRLSDPPALMGLRSFVAALALHDAFTALTGPAAVGLALKWPNDVLMNGGKLTGILLEASGDVLVIGIGVNLIAAPPADAVEAGAVPPVSLWAETGLRIQPETFLDALIPAMARREAQFRQQGFAPIRADWLSHAARLGERIVARTGQTRHEGIFETVDPEGNLILMTAQGQLAIPAADVFF